MNKPAALHGIDPSIVQANRRHLHAVRHWIDPATYHNSKAFYGCPPPLRHLLDLPINHEPNCTDLLVEAALQMGEPVSYLEIGVSVGKNFYVLAKALEHARLYGFDCERINPVLETHFEKRGQSGPESHYVCGSNRITYLQGDVFCPQDWRRLAGEKFNLVFSDAVHRPGALLEEWKMIEELELLDSRRFCLLWDDLDREPDGPMTRAFLEIAEQLQRRHRLRDEQVFLTEVNGWLGQHEHTHTVGVVTTLL